MQYNKVLHACAPLLDSAPTQEVHVVKKMTLDGVGTLHTQFSQPFTNAACVVKQVMWVQCDTSQYSTSIVQYNEVLHMCALSELTRISTVEPSIPRAPQR